MSRSIDPRQIEVPDDEVVKSLRAMGGIARLRMLDELSESGRQLMEANVLARHPSWTREEIVAEVAKRIRRASA